MNPISEIIPSTPPILETVAAVQDANPGGDIFGGWMMSQMDLVGGAQAFSYVGGRVVTAGVQDMSFIRPVFVGDRLRFYGEIVRIGRTSISIFLNVWAQSGQGAGFEKVAQALYTFVAVDSYNRPVPIQPVSIASAA